MKIKKKTSILYFIISFSFLILYIAFIGLIVSSIRIIISIISYVNFGSNTDIFIVLISAILPHIILILILPLLIYLFLRNLKKDYCFNCRTMIYPVFKKHKCNISKSELEDKNLIALYELNKNEWPYLDRIITSLKVSNILRNEKEESILMYDLMALKPLELTNNYKFPLIAMGSILEFILIRYCKMNDIKPEAYIDLKGDKIKGKKFINYLQAAIKLNLFGQKNSWYIAQNNLREFRNYVHLENEMNKELIDHKWVDSIKSAFYRILENIYVNEEIIKEEQQDVAN